MAAPSQAGRKASELFDPDTGAILAFLRGLTAGAAGTIRTLIQAVAAQGRSGRLDRHPGDPQPGDRRPAFSAACGGRQRRVPVGAMKRRPVTLAAASETSQSSGGTMISGCSILLAIARLVADDARCWSRRPAPARSRSRRCPPDPPPAPPSPPRPPPCSRRTAGSPRAPSCRGWW